MGQIKEAFTVLTAPALNHHAVTNTGQVAGVLEELDQTERCLGSPVKYFNETPSLILPVSFGKAGRK